MDERPPSGPLDDLDDRLKRLREKGETGSRRTSASRAASGVGFGLRVGVELLAALVVGGGVGFFLDRWLGTKPWLFLVFFLLGFAAGILNVYRLMTGQGYAAGYQAPSKVIDERDPDEKT
jgi:ATP synthase protein I